MGLVVLLPVICSISVTISQCVPLQDVPQATIYPNATLVGRTGAGVGGSYFPFYPITARLSWVEETYITNDAPEEILQFFGEEGYCREGGNSCIGSTEPFGTWILYIDRNSYNVRQQTGFFVRTEWRSCGFFNEI
jgi:hypothetical protein